MYKKLLYWSKDQHSHLPWRENRSLYLTLVSEIMLQQTTVQTVVNHIDKFLKKYPTLKSLAKSSEEEVCIAWKGLGYYRRARNLLNAAKEIQEKFDGVIPTDVETLKKIKGIGDYTANAIVGIGAGKKALAVDANLERVIARLFAIEVVKGPKLQKEIYKQFHEGKILKELTNKNSRELNEAFMDLGRVLCQSRKAECLLCPMKKSCQSLKLGIVDKIPKIEAKKIDKHELDLLRVVVKSKGKVLGYTKTSKEWLSGQIEVPTFILKSSDENLSQYPTSPIKLSVKDLRGKVQFKSSITKYKITNYIIELDKEEFEKNISNVRNYKFFKRDFENINFTTTTMKLLKNYFK
ncbi:hypothetical protein [Halobacteriovorax sp. JY17]|uniref:A/G-specific adenine glycosylase n=1 Tax=Halobacteriovorax sp. JY17 TaxID=2014617 RepID=UPI000C5C21D1|nr:hypothetical protein [Halobacteriovorax sp. JY17]PIK14052.1 MAG: hypothetical protein CES88_13800 [Halobacteriovorax sp. JY17]